MILLLRSTTGFKRQPFRSKISNRYDKSRANLYIHRSASSASRLLSTKAERALYEVIKNVSVDGNTTATLLNVIRMGDSFMRQQICVEDKVEADQLEFYNNVESHWEVVPGCMADARLWTSITSSGTEIQGIADSRVAQGMIAILAHGLKYFSAKEILALEFNEITDKSQLNTILPPGRLNGFQNMLQLIQKQVKRITSIVEFHDDDIGQVFGKIEKNDERNEIALKHEILQKRIFSIPDSSKDEIAMLISGGVDSSVALKLLLDQGYKVRAFYLKIWLEDEVAHLNECPWEKDLYYAQQVCDQLDVPLETVSLQKEYWDQVVQYTFDEAKHGRTPNPDIMCNTRIKFGMFYDYIGKYFSKVATGHYAQVRVLDNGIAELFQSPDAVKDQTYFLSNLRQNQLQKALFPIGHLEKYQVRELAQQFDLINQKRKDSQGICFLGKLKFDDFISYYLGEKIGPILDYSSQKVIGQHRGLWFHTIGQRKGIGPLLGPGIVNDGPWYIAAKDPVENALYITNDLSVIEKPRKEFLVKDINWICFQDKEFEENQVELDIKLRHGPTVVKGVLTCQEGRWISVKVNLHEKDKGIAPGQFAAFYKNKVCLGSGVIDLSP